MEELKDRGIQGLQSLSNKPHRQTLDVVRAPLSEKSCLIMHRDRKKVSERKPDAGRSMQYILMEQMHVFLKKNACMWEIQKLMLATGRKCRP